MGAVKQDDFDRQLRRQVNERPADYDVKTLALDTAKTDFELPVVGDYLFVAFSAPNSVAFNVKLNEQNAPALNVKVINPINAMFRKLYLTWGAAAGVTATLFIGRDASFAAQSQQQTVRLYDANGQPIYGYLGISEFAAGGVFGLTTLAYGYGYQADDAYFRRNIWSERAKARDNLESIFNILSTRGEILCALPLSEASGTIFNDLMRPTRVRGDLTGGVTLRASSPLLPGVTLDGTTGYITQKALDYSRTRVSGVVANAAAKLFAQKFTIAPGTKVGLIRLLLKLTGAPNGTLTLTICPDDGAGNPNEAAPIANGTSAALSMASISAAYDWLGFTFATPPSLSYGVTYWLVLTPTDSTTPLDGSNYITWGTDNVATHGGLTASVDTGATWTPTAGTDTDFEVYNDAFLLNDSFSLLVLAKRTAAAAYGVNRHMVSFNNLPNDSLAIYEDTVGLIRFYVADGSARTISYPLYSATEWGLYGLTWTKAATSVMSAYHNGRLLAALNCGAASVPAQPTGPLILGARRATATVEMLWDGGVAMLIMVGKRDGTADGVITAAEMARIASMVIPRRLAGETI